MLKDLGYVLTSAVPGFIYAILLLIVAFIVAGIARSIIKKVLKGLKLEKYIEKLGIKSETTGSSLDFIGNLVYIIVFLMFMPGIFARLGMASVTAPITSMITRFLNYIPSLIAAIIILVVGVFIAKIVRQLLLPLLKRLNVDVLQEKAGIETKENTSVSAILANVVYVLILIPMIIAALQALNIRAISDPAITMLDKIFAFLPNIFVATAILVIGVFIANTVEKLLASVLAGLGADTYLNKFVAAEGAKSFSFSKTISAIAKYIIALLFVVEAINVLDLEVLRFVGEGIIAYLPAVISALIILGLAYFLASWIEGLIKNKLDNNFLAVGVKAIILVIAVIMTLSQLGIATAIVNAAFIIVLGAFAIAFAIAFGVGGRDFAAKTMKKLDEKDE